MNYELLPVIGAAIVSAHAALAQVHATLALAAATAFAGLTNHGAIMQAARFAHDASDYEPWDGDEEIAAAARRWFASVVNGGAS